MRPPDPPGGLHEESLNRRLPPGLTRADFLSQPARHGNRARIGRRCRLAQSDAVPGHPLRTGAPGEPGPCKTPAGPKRMAAGPTSLLSRIARRIRRCARRGTLGGPACGRAKHVADHSADAAIRDCKATARATQDFNSIAGRETSLRAAPPATPDHERHPQNARAVNPEFVLPATSFDCPVPSMGP